MTTKTVKKTKNVLKFVTANATRDEVAAFCVKIAKERNLVNRKKKAFAGNPQFAAIYNTEELQEILNITITKVVNAFEAFIFKLKGIDLPEYAPEIGAELDLTNWGQITGYLISAYDKNISKDYKKYTANKREGELISYDVSNEDDHEEKQNLVIFNQIKCTPIEDISNNQEYERAMNVIFKFLRNYDKKENERMSNKGKKIIPEIRKSKFSYLFMYLINPKYKGKYIYMKDKVCLTPYLFNKKKDEMVELLQTHFKEETMFLYDFLAEKSSAYGAQLRPKKTENYYDQSCTTSTCFEEKYLANSKVKVIIHYQLNRLNNGKIEKIEAGEKNKIVDFHLKDQAKEELKMEAQMDIENLKAKAASKKKKALTDIYEYNAA